MLSTRDIETMVTREASRLHRRESLRGAVLRWVVKSALPEPGSLVWFEGFWTGQKAISLWRDTDNAHNDVDDRSGYVRIDDVVIVVARAIASGHDDPSKNHATIDIDFSLLLTTGGTLGWIADAMFDTSQWKLVKGAPC